MCVSREMLGEAITHVTSHSLLASSLSGRPQCFLVLALDSSSTGRCGVWRHGKEWEAWLVRDVGGVVIMSYLLQSICPSSSRT